MPDVKSNVAVWGKWWFGLIRIRVFFDGPNYKTLWHVSLWKFSFGMSFPAFLVRLFEKKD